MITKMIYRCAACGELFALDVSHEKNLSPFQGQVSFHPCAVPLPLDFVQVQKGSEKSTIQGIGNLIAFFETPEEDS